MGDISRLDAVNQMLLLAGESLVSDLENQSGLDTELAEFVLDRFTNDFQLRGLANNKVIKKITLTDKGRIAIDADALSAELCSHHINTDGYTIIGVLQGTGTDKHLFNVTDQTDQWKKNTEYKYELVISLPWEKMDTPVQRAILASATRQYQMVTQGDGDIDKYLMQEEMFYRAKGVGSDLDDRRRNVFSSGSNKLNDARTRNDFYRDATVLRYWRTRPNG